MKFSSAVRCRADFYRNSSMKKFRKWKLCAALLCVIPCVLSSSHIVSAISLSSITSESIRQKESQISEAQNQKKQLQAGLTDVQNLKKNLESQKKDLENYVVSLDANLEEIQAKIDELNNLITEKEGEIEETEAELVEAIRIQTEQYEAMKKRIKFMYEKGDSYYLEMMFQATSFGEMLNKFDYIQSLSDYDSQKLAEYVTIRQYVEVCKEQLESEKEVLDEAKQDVQAEEASLQELISQKEGEIVAYQSDINNKAAAIAEYEAYIKEQNEIIASLEAAVAAERKRLAEQSGKKLTYDGGMFAFPAPSYTRVSDDYGTRTHPILGIQQFHNGVDLAAPNGSPILAAYDGEVVAAAYSGTMGNYIMIDHGDSMYTIYMHASALYVSKGDLVSKGEKIAAVGSTGRSTGPHLHFSVRVNGSYVSPWNYLK